VFDPRMASIARRCGLTSRELNHYLELELIAVPGGEVGDATVRRIRRIRRMRRDLDIDLEVVAIIMRLLDRIQELEASGPRSAHYTGRVVKDDA